MKKIITLFALLGAITAFGQHKIGEHVARLVKQKTDFKPYAPLTAGNTRINGDDVVSNAQYAVLNSEVVKHLAAAKYDALELNIPYNGKTVTTQLYRVEVMAEGFHVDTDKGTNASFERGAHYRGIVKGEYESVVSFNFFNNELNGIISNDELGNLVVGKMVKEGNISDYIIYQDANLLVKPNYTCSAEDPDHDHSTHRDSNGAQDVLSNRCVTMYFEVDHNIFLQNNSNVTQTNNWMTAVFNNVQTLYANDGITTALKSVFIWTTPDPYTGDSSADYLGQFHQVRPSFDGDLGQLVGIDPGGLGGVAVTIAGICSNYNWSYSDVDFNFSTVPTFSWTVQVITHEFGHLMGSPHTHGCYWNGNNTAIDGCGTQAGFVEGSCLQGPIPTAAEKGTIMSYCHLIPGIGIKFSNGFGPQPAARILNHVETSTCLSTDCINTCINAIEEFTLNTTTTSATINWVDPSNINGPWQVSVAALNSPFITWQTVVTTSYSVSGLTANTYYKFAVRPVCAAGVTTTTKQLVFATDANWCSGVTFTDTGGSGNYPNNQHLIRTLKPTAPGARITVNINSLGLEEGYDYLYIYEGPSTNSPVLDILTGSFNPGFYESGAPDGSLTFEFISDEGVTASGWNMSVSCANLSAEENAFIDFRYYPNPTSGTVTIRSAEIMEQVTVYNVAGQLLLNKAIGNSETSVDISSFAEGVYFFKVSNGSKEANFRIVKQN